MNIKKTGLNLIGLSISLLLWDFPLFGFFTTSRIGFIVFILGFLYYYTGAGKVFPAIPKHLKPINFALLLTIIAVFISTLISMSDIDNFLTVLITSMMTVLLSRGLNNKENSLRIFKAASYFSVAFVIILVLFCIFKFGVLAYSSRTLRHNVNEWGPGLSRIVNGVTFANIILLATYILSKSRVARNIFLTSLAISFWFVLSAQSRQGLILHILLLLSFALAIYPTFKYKKTALIASLIIIGYFMHTIFNSQIFIDNFLNRTVSQLETDEGSTAQRLYFYEEGLKYIENNLIFGIGPGNFLKYVGKDAHSGYLRIVVESGLLAALGILIIIYHCCSEVLKTIKIQNLSFPSILFVILLAPLFNSIYDTPMFWVTLLFTVHLNAFNLKTDNFFS